MYLWVQFQVPDSKPDAQVSLLTSCYGMALPETILIGSLDDKV